MRARETPVKIPFDSLTLRATVQELAPVLTGGYVQDIRQPEASDIWLDIRNRGHNIWMILSCDARFARVHLTARRPRNPGTPPPFCMVLRKYIRDGRITAVRQRDFDRVFEMEIERRDALGEPVSYTLIAELMGKHSNLILIDAHGVVLDAAKRITHRVNRIRQILPNRHYTPPPRQEDHLSPFHNDPLTVLHEELAALQTFPLTDADQDCLISLLVETFLGMSPFLAQEIVTRVQYASSLQEGLREVWKQIFDAARCNDYAPVRVTYQYRVAGAYPFPVAQIPAQQQRPAASLNEALDQAFDTQMARAAFYAAASDLKARIEQEIRRLDRQRESAWRSLQEIANAERHRRYGELILAHAWRIAPGAERAVVLDYFDPATPEISIPLDPERNAPQNAEAYFQRYHRARRNEAMIQQMLQQAEEAVARLEQARDRLTDWLTTGQETVDSVRELRAELVQKGLLRASEIGDAEKHTAPDFEGHRIKRYTTPEGYEILVGESATANDFLTTRVARPDDLWLHVRAATSAHVVIRTQGHPANVPGSVIEQAALLCARNSSQKHSRLVAVDCTLKKYVRKPRGSPPGSVDYQRETTLHVNPQD
ncbi:MAG: NFACT family protein [Chloroherpetonaceae bacterium]|nr:NFACT family protein [Chthonomonadaceae bacterium]MDW8208345.1 NFACT family protein [Chloroherpetonaceae bacterium]